MNFLRGKRSKKESKRCKDPVREPLGIDDAHNRLQIIREESLWLMERETRLSTEGIFRIMGGSHVSGNLTAHMDTWEAFLRTGQSADDLTTHPPWRDADGDERDEVFMRTAVIKKVLRHAQTQFAEGGGEGLLGNWEDWVRPDTDDVDWVTFRNDLSGVELAVAEERAADACTERFSELDPTRRETIGCLLELLHAVAGFSESNMMTTQNLAIVFASTLFTVADDSNAVAVMEASGRMNSAVEFLITRQPEFSEVLKAPGSGSMTKAARS